MSRAIDPRATFPFSTKEDMKLPAEKRTVWTLKGLRLSQYEAIQNGAAVIVKDETRINSGSVTVATLQAGIEDVSNFMGADLVDLDRHGDVEIPFESEKVHGQTCASLAFIERIHPDDRTEIAEAIGKYGSLSEDQAGKS